MGTWSLVAPRAGAVTMTSTLRSKKWAKSCSKLEAHALNSSTRPETLSAWAFSGSRGRILSITGAHCASPAPGPTSMPSYRV